MTDYRASGIYLPLPFSGEKALAFIPDNLPAPNVPLDGTLQDTYEKANRALGRLDGISALLPDTSLFIYFYVRKEAVLSSQIEGTQSSLSDLLLYEQVPGVPMNDVIEVSNYVAALQHGIDRVTGDDFPISSRLLRELHALLLRDGRGAEKRPGNFRTSQNWIGGTRPGNARYVPPPHTHVQDLMGNLENYIHDAYGRTPALIKAAIAHVQFESIHPFEDGNGRLGRLLITLLLCSERVLQDPTLYLSLYFKKHRNEYYDRLQQVRERSAWREWLGFFLEGVYETAQQAFTSAQAILKLFQRDRSRIQALGRIRGSVLQVHDLLQRRVVVTSANAHESLNMSRAAILRSIAQLEEMGILREMTGNKRNRIWYYQDYITLLDDGT